MASRAAWEQAPIIVLPFSAPSLPADQGGSPFMMELLALTGALQLLAHLQLQGTVYSDCQGLICNFHQRNVLRLNTNSTGYPLFRDCKRLISGNHSIQSWWSQDQWGNYIADLHASPPPHLSHYKPTRPHHPSDATTPCLFLRSHTQDRLAFPH